MLPKIHFQNNRTSSAFLPKRNWYKDIQEVKIQKLLLLPLLALMPLCMVKADTAFFPISVSGEKASYCAEATIDQTTGSLCDSVLIVRRDNAPDDAKRSISADGKSFLVLYPKKNPQGNYIGRKNSYTPAQGDIVLYHYENDSFEKIGTLDLKKPLNEQTAYITKFVYKLIEQAEAPAPQAQPENK